MIFSSFQVCCMQSSCSTSHESQIASSPNVKKYEPFWNDLTQRLANQCWLPLRTNTEPPSQWNDSLKKLALGSWVTVSSTKPTFDELVPDGDGIWESFKDGVISLTRNENEDVSSSLSSSSSSEKPPAEKALKIRLYPNSEEKQKLLKWFGTARWTYNQCLAAINNDIKIKIKNICAQIISLVNLKNLKTLILSGFLI